MRVTFLLAVLAVLAALQPSGPALADKSGPPQTYTRASDDGEYVFVMLSPRSLEEEVRTYNDQAAARVRAIRGKYTRSGLYKGDSREPLWTVDWYRGNVIVPSDGVHLVRFEYRPLHTARKQNPIAKEDLQREALAFFARGKLLRGYAVAELVDRPDLLPRSVVHFGWMKAHKLLDRGRLEVVTHDGNRLTFDLKTGKILKKERAGS
jgi:hypothetical protein